MTSDDSVDVLTQTAHRARARQRDEPVDDMRRYRGRANTDHTSRVCGRVSNPSMTNDDSDDVLTQTTYRAGARQRFEPVDYMRRY